ncbi:MAG: ferritin family protein [Rhizobiales bacterium]|nr:ferritin family protein [Hyphomicrobiales bacterium]
MTSLKDEPAGRIRSMSEFFALAHAMELDAATRYTETSRQLRAQGETALADLFGELAETERGHIRQIDEWKDHDPSQGNADLPWPIPDTFDGTPEEMAGTRLLTPYQALASAVRHEQRSFGFWTYVAAHADARDVREAAEQMALEELEHVSLLRRERRKAFHAGRLEGRPAGEAPVTLAALATFERRLADLMARDASSAHEPTRSLAAAAKDAAAKLEALHAAKHPVLSLPALATELTSDQGALAEYLAEAYLRLAETSQDGDVVSIAQEVAREAIYRLGVLGPKGPVDPDE